MDERRTDLTEILRHVNPAELDYTEWINVGMALKHEGYSCSDWDAWSSMDPSRYRRGECARKWNGFHGSASPVTGGTIYQIAVEHGWAPDFGGSDALLDWNSEITSDGVIVDASWIEEEEIREPQHWNPAQELIKYLETLFDADDNVGYVTQSWKRDEGDGGTKWIPSKGNWDRTAGKLIEELSRCNGDIGSVLGDSRPEAGAWIRFNPLDGKGCKNDNVTDYRYALVESDSVPVEKQNAIIRELELPVAALVFSGKKSLHAIVRIEAEDLREYKKRVEFLYSVCKKNGLDVDTQNKNPSRLSRMPGVMRMGRKQFLVDTNLGKPSWREWQEWVEGVTDDLPEPESLSDVWDSLPPLKECLIDGVLRIGHKMLISGPSKAGKSFLQIELCIAVAEGRKWLKWSCRQGKILYVNLELDRASCLRRFKDVYDTLGIRPHGLKNIDIWNLRGKSVPMDQLAPKLIRRAQKKDYIAIVIDPIYKIITGDENSADQMAKFCNQFDRVCTELGCAVIYCHHHSKGSQGGKKSMDRASGSGVFARDPDALLDLIELEPTEALITQKKNEAACKVCLDWLKKINREDEASQDDSCSKVRMMDHCHRLLAPEDFMRLREEVRGAEASVDARTAWRIEGTLREFPKFPPVNVWFDYPVHRLDETGALGDISPENAGKLPFQTAKKKTPQERKKERQTAFETAFSALDFEKKGRVNLSDLEEYMGVTKNTMKKYVDEADGFRRENGTAVRVSKSKIDT